LIYFVVFAQAGKFFIDYFYYDPGGFLLSITFHEALRPRSRVCPVQPPLDGVLDLEMRFLHRLDVLVDPFLICANTNQSRVDICDLPAKPDRVHPRSRSIF
jgi:hypothetical protein